MKYSKPIVHSSASKLVIRTLLRVKRESGCWNIRETARLLQVNPRWVYDNLVKGLEPTDKTEKGQEVRIKLGLKRYKKKEKIIREKKVKPSFIVEWDHLSTDERHRVIKEYLHWKENKNGK